MLHVSVMFANIMNHHGQNFTVCTVFHVLCLIPDLQGFCADIPGKRGRLSPRSIAYLVPQLQCSTLAALGSIPSTSNAGPCVGGSAH